MQHILRICFCFFNLGRSQRGSTVYAGISHSGSLVAIYEWKFTVPVDRKDKPIGSGGTTGGDISTVEGLMKQVSIYY